MTEPLIHFERDYDEARNEFYGLTDDPSKVVNEWNTRKGKLSYNDSQEIKEVVCDKLCMWPSEFKDPEDLWNEKCDRCPLAEKLMEFEDE